MNSSMWTKTAKDRRYFVGGSDARIIMGSDEAALLRLWREKRGEVAPEDLSGNLTVQLGLATEKLNRRWYEANTGQVITDVQCLCPDPRAYLEHEQAKTELKGLMAEDAKEAIGHGVRAKRSKSGAVSFDLLVQEGSHAAVE